jgi:hypothetical protein
MEFIRNEDKKLALHERQAFNLGGMITFGAGSRADDFSTQALSKTSRSIL